MPEQSADKPSPTIDQELTELTEEYIRVRAYQLFEERGRHDGYDVEDWLRAESELIGKKQPEYVTEAVALGIKAASAS